MQLTWPATGEDVTYYQCLRRSTTTGQWEQLGHASAKDLSYMDKAPGRGTYIYGIQAVNSYGTASSITESQVITI